MTKKTAWLFNELVYTYTNMDQLLTKYYYLFSATDLIFFTLGAYIKSYKASYVFITLYKCAFITERNFACISCKVYNNKRL